MPETEVKVLRRRVAELEEQLRAVHTDGHGPSPDKSVREASEQARLASEAKYRSLFDSIDEGFCIIEVLFDNRGAAVDYRFLEVNPAFEAQTGLVEAVGRRIREMA